MGGRHRKAAMTRSILQDAAGPPEPGGPPARGIRLDLVPAIRFRPRSQETLQQRTASLPVIYAPSSIGSVRHTPPTHTLSAAISGCHSANSSRSGASQKRAGWTSLRVMWLRLPKYDCDQRHMTPRKARNLSLETTIDGRQSYPVRLSVRPPVLSVFVCECQGLRTLWE